MAQFMWALSLIRESIAACHSPAVEAAFPLTPSRTQICSKCLYASTYSSSVRKSNVFMVAVVVSYNGRFPLEYRLLIRLRGMLEQCAVKAEYGL